MALSAAYFVGELMIPNISGTTVTELSNLHQLNIAIAKYEPLYLEELLGEDLYTAYAAGIAAVSPLAKWTALRDKIYVTNLTLGIGFSPAADYVYFHFMRNQATVSLMNTEGIPDHENFTAASVNQKIVAAWNDMVRLSDEIQDWLDEDTQLATYPEWLTAEHTYFDKINIYGC